MVKKSVNAFVAENMTAPGYGYVPIMEDTVTIADFLP